MAPPASSPNFVLCPRSTSPIATPIWGGFSRRHSIRNVALTRQEPLRHGAVRYDIIAIGASAGGLTPLRMLVAALPEDLTASIFVVVHIGVHPAPLRFYTVAYCTPCCPWPWAGRLARQSGRGKVALGILHAILTPRIEVQFMACNVGLRLETWRAFYIARHDNTP
jgi:hypothetical protein